MSESSPSTCPRCGAPLSGSSAEGLCPRCLLAMNLEDPTRLTGDETLPVKPPRAALSPEELAPHFPQLEILECLGRGGMGVVYKARQKSLNRFVALKLLAPERADDEAFTSRFEREAHALAALSHPNIVTVHDYGQVGGFCYLLMEFVDGVNLRQAMKASHFTPEQALAMVPPICEALQYAHEHGIVHRDIKPENLLLDKAGRVKIADFGIAKMVAPDVARHSDVGTQAASDSTSEHSATIAAGTPRYMAPEQKSDPAHADHRADIYSLGVVLYEMLTGELPAGKLEPLARRLEALHIDVRIDEIVLRALETTPELRFQTAADFRTQVQTVVATSHGSHASRAPLKSARAFFTSPEFLATFMGGFWIQQGRGDIALYEDHLVFAAAWERTEIPFTAIRELRLVRYPFRANPGGLQAVSITHEVNGQLKRLYFTPADSWFGFVGTINDRVAEWFVAVRDAIKSATGKLPVGVDAPPQVVTGVAWTGCALVFLPLVALGLVLGGFVLLSNHAANIPISAYLIGLGPFLILAAVFAIVALTVRARSARAQAFVRGDAPPPPQVSVEGLSQRELIFKVFGIHSKWGRRCLAISWLGWLGFLGAIPGWHRMWGFTGFFGFIGVATFIELFHRRGDGTRHPAMRTWWHKAIVSALLVLVIALPVHLFLLQVFVIPTNSAAPELPKGSRLLVWKLVHDFVPGDMIVYQEGDHAMAGRVVKVNDETLVVQRNKTQEVTVPKARVIGKVILNTRVSSENLPAPALPPVKDEPPPATPPVPPPVVNPKQAAAPDSVPAKRVYASGVPGKIEKWQNDVPFTDDPQLRYVAWLPAKASETLQLWTPSGAKQAGRCDIPAETWDFWNKHTLNEISVREGGGRIKMPPGPLLLFFLSDRAIDENSSARVKVFKAPDAEIDVKSWVQHHKQAKTPGEDGWSLVGCPLPENTAGTTVMARLALTAGTWQNTATFPAGYQGGSGFGSITIGGTGEDLNHQAFITVMVNEKYGPIPQWNMLANLPDGTVVGFRNAHASYSDGIELNTVCFAQKLSELSGFFMRHRDSKTTEFKDVKVPPLADVAR